MNNLNIKAFGGLFFLMVIMGLALFLPAGSMNYSQAWVYLVLFFVSATVITLYLVKNDPVLLQRRVKAGPTAEKQTNQKIIQSIAQIAFLAVLLVSAFDHRFRWSDVPVIAVIAGDILIITGFFIVFFVFKENTFTSGTIEVVKDQKVITTGPYSLVRHPMYSGALVMLIGTPMALGSWWGLLTFMPIAAVIVFRLIDEEKYLSENLSGYKEYCVQVRARLIPGIF